MMDDNKTILVIDDDVDFQVMMTTVLHNSGYKVKSLFTGIVEEASVLAKACDIILLDIEMPGESGVVLGQNLKSDPATLSVPIILVSAHTEGDGLFKQSQADAFLQKPFSLKRLLGKINEMLSDVQLASRPVH